MSAPGQPASIEVAQQRLSSAIKDTYRIEKLERTEPAYQVFRAVEIASGRLVYAYQVLTHIAQRKGYLERFQSDMRKLQRLRAHPAFPEVLEFCADSPEKCYLITVYPAVTDVSLSKQLARGVPVTLPKALHNLGLLGEAIDAAHREGLVHYHLSPERILLSDDENGGRTLRVLGFGLLQHGNDALDAKSGSEYLAPELLRNEPTDARTDQFVLAAIAYEMLSGRKAFALRNDTQEQIRDRILREDPLPIPLNHARESFINSALNKSFSKARQQRHASVRELCYELGLQVERMPPPAVPRSHPGPQRSFGHLALAVAGLILIIVLGLILRPRISRWMENWRLSRSAARDTKKVLAKVDMALPATTSEPLDAAPAVAVSADLAARPTPEPPRDMSVSRPPVAPLPPKTDPPSGPKPPPIKPPPPEQPYSFRYEPSIIAKKRTKLEKCLRDFNFGFVVELTQLSRRYRVITPSPLQKSNELRFCLDENFGQGKDDLPDPLTIHKEKRGR